ncbi:MAG TPA: hypothetical protein DDW19_00315 [Anaerolineaceae bacterium]|jgi:hypothetical protein|nr:hypothetical protein [Anaerolineaceae bacterium]
MTGLKTSGTIQVGIWFQPNTVFNMMCKDALPILIPATSGVDQIILTGKVLLVKTHLTNLLG